MSGALGAEVCEFYTDAGQDCVTTGPEVVAAEGLCGPCSSAYLDALAAETARREVAEAKVADLTSRLACVAEATYWDRPYDTRIAAIRGMCDLSTDGMTPAALSEADQ